MAIGVDIHVDLGRLERDLRMLARNSGITVNDVCNEQMRLACNSLMHEPKAISYAARKRAVAGDMNAIFYKGIDDPDLERTWEMTDPPKSRRFVGVRVFKRKNRAPFGVPHEFFKSGEGEMQSWHASRKNGKGRVRGSNSYHGKQKGIGIKHIAVVRRNDLERYTKLVQSHIGQLAAGWWNAALRYAHLAHGSVKAPPWVARAYRKMGSAGGRIDHGGNGEIYAVNEVPWADQSLMKYYAEKEAKNRTVDCDKWAAKRFDQLIARFNAAHAAWST